MTDLFTKPIDKITTDDVAALLEHGPAEGPAIEYKAALSEAKEDPDPWMAGRGGIGGRARDRIVKEVVAFANAGGGTLVLGVAETDDDPPRPGEIRPLPRCTELATTLTDILKSAIDPTLPLIHIQPVRTNGAAGVVVIRVPASRRAPHRCANTRHAYKRFHHQSTPIDMREIHEMVLHTRSGLERLERSFADRRRRLEEHLADVQVLERRKDVPRFGYICSATIVPVRPLELDRLTSDVPTALALRSYQSTLRGKSVVPATLHCLGVAGDRRPILRGFRYDRRDGDPSARREVFQDGVVDFWFRALPDQIFGSPDWSLGLVPEWTFGLIVNAILAAHHLRLAAGSPEEELAIAVEFHEPVAVPWLRKVALPWDKFDFRGFARHAQIEELPEFPRYSLGALSELPTLLRLIHRDYWDAIGRSFDWDLEADVDDLLQQAGMGSMS